MWRVECVIADSSLEQSQIIVLTSLSRGELSLVLKYSNLRTSTNGPVDLGKHVNNSSH